LSDFVLINQYGAYKKRLPLAFISQCPNGLFLKFAIPGLTRNDGSRKLISVAVYFIWYNHFTFI